MAETLAAVILTSGSAVSAGGAASLAAGTVATAAGTYGLTTAASIGAASAAASSVVSLASTIGTIGTLLSGGFTALQFLSKANATAGSSEAQARALEIQARQEEIRGIQESNVIKQRTLRALATNNAAAGARGIDISSGSFKDVQAEIQRQSDMQLSITRGDSEASSLSDYISASNKRSDAAYEQQSGIFGAGASLFETAFRASARGGP